MTTATASRTNRAQSTGDAGTLTGTWKLVRFALRRDRVRLPAWVLGISGLMAYFVTALNSLLTTSQDLEAMTGFLSDPAGALLTGPGFGFDSPSLERVLAGAYGPYILIAAALMSLLTVTRHTRAEERLGRAELIRANVVGRHATLTAALTVAALMNLLVVVLIALLMTGNGFDPQGSWLFAASIGAAGLAFAGVTAAAAQFSAYPRAAAGAAGAVLGAAFALRGLGDMAASQDSGPQWLSWLSPLGWSQQTAPYVHDRWLPLALSLGLAVVASAVGYVLSTRRDLDAGLVPPRPGPRSAAAWLRGPFTLAYRLQRASLIGWSLALLVAGAAYGWFAQPMLDGFADMPDEMLAMLGDAQAEQNMLDGYLGLMGLMMAFIVAVFAVLAVQALRNEETVGRAEPVLATAVSRSAWTGGHLAVTALGALWLLAVAGAGMGAGAVASTGDFALFGDLMLGHMAHIPAVWLVLAMAALLYGLAPRALPLIWAVVVYSFFVGLFAPMLDLPDAAVRVSPFAHIGQYPLDDVSGVAVVMLAVSAAAASCGALAAFRSRDVASS